MSTVEERNDKELEQVTGGASPHAESVTGDESRAVSDMVRKVEQKYTGWEAQNPDRP